MTPSEAEASSATARANDGLRQLAIEASSQSSTTLARSAQVAGGDA